MIKKRIAIAGMAACLALTATFTGCSLVSKNSKADMEQVVATVDIKKADKFEDSKLIPYKDAISSESVIIKRDLVSYFLNVGYSYVQNNNYTYEQTFNMLMNSLVNSAILTQYATLELLKDKSTNTQSDLGYDANALSKYTALTSEKDKYEYLLGGEDSEQVQLAKYSLYSSLNSAIDSYEKTIIEEETEFKGTGTRTTPTNVDTEQENYYPANEDKSLNYGVYTGYESNLLADSGAYQDDALDGTTRSTRVKAYNTFINNLRNNSLIDSDESGNLNKILELKYIQNEYVSQLESRIVSKYYDDIYHVQQEEELKKDNYKYVDKVFNDMLEDQTDNYSTASSFESAMSSLSSTSFILYNPSTADSEIKGTTDNKQGKFGFVYNILLPFNARQSVKLAELTSIKTADDDDDYYYYERNQLLKQIRTEDQRSVWFNGESNYSFKVSESDPDYEYYGKGAGREYLFFEGNLLDSEEGGRYEKLQAYDGRYSYNGRVYENTDGSYTVIGNELDIDGMLKEFSAYINFVLNDGNKSDNHVVFDNGYNPDTKNTAYYTEKNFKKSKDEIDYSKLVYASGHVELKDGSAFNDTDLFNIESDRYKAMSAVNELQFAYTTDTSVLSQYVGYSVSAYDTSYIKEFEYAAKLAVSQGSGTFTVCAGDYGWHLIYVTHAYAFGTDGKVYTPNWAENIGKEGTFENLFFEWIKTTNLSDVTTTRRNKIINDYNKEDVTVVKYENRYKNLLNLDKN